MTNRTLSAPSGSTTSADHPSGGRSPGPTQVLPRSTPAEQGLDASAVDRLLDALERAGLELHSLMVLRHGHVVAEGWWEPYQPDEPHLLYSLSKSFTATAVGLAVEEGLLSVDDLVTSFFPEETPDAISPFVASMRVRHLLSMATGHHEDTLDRLDRRHLVASFLALAPDEEPGTWFTYNNGATMMLSAIMTKVTGGRLLDFLRPRLLEPLGISQANWQGIGDLDLGFTGLHLTTEAVATFGQLYLSRGVWEGRALVPESWVAEATRVQVDNPREPNPDWRQGYGYQFWMGQTGYRGDGAFGQFCLVLPEQDAVVAMTSATEDMQAILDCVWAELLPALQAEDHRGAGVEALSARLGRLRLPVAPGERSAAALELPWTRSTDEVAAGAEDSAGADGLGVEPSRADVEASDAAGAPIVTVTSIEEAAGGWRLRLADAVTTFAVDCGYGEWVRSEVEVQPGFRLAVAASGAWSGPTTFTAEVALVNTPHRLALSCDCATGVTTARWHVPLIRPTPPSALALEVARG